MTDIQRIKLSEFATDLWLRLQAVTCGLVIAMILFSLFFMEKNSDKSYISVSIVFCLSHCFISIIPCKTYYYITIFWIKYTNLWRKTQLSAILYHAGWVNVLVYFILFLVALSLSFDYNIFEDKNKIQILYIPVFFILSGQIAIYWNIKQVKPFEGFQLVPAKIENMIAEIGEKEDLTTPQS